MFDRYGGSRELQTIINGDLDVFPDHATHDRMLDAGAEVGAFTRDLAVFSDPRFSSLWESGKKSTPTKLAELVIPSYYQLFERKIPTFGVR